MTERSTVNIRSRPGTQDEEVFRDVLCANCYQLPKKFMPDDVIIDVGAHIGIFTIACLLRGAGKVWCYEPDEANFSLLKSNLAEHGDRVFLCKSAIWGNLDDKLLFSGYPERATACGSVLPGCTVDGANQEIPVERTVLDEAIDAATDSGRGRVRLLKIDAEGAEYPALYTSEKLDLVDEIVGECHDIRNLKLHLSIPGHDRFDMVGVKRFLQGQGFYVSYRPSGNEMMSLFFASR